MAQKLQPSKSLPRKEAFTVRPVDALFDQYAASHQNPSNKLIHWVCVPLIVFSVLGLVWCIPFPYLKILGRYNGFVNWASFLIGFSVYYYYRLSPVLSYFMLLIIFAFSFGIIQLEEWQRSGGPQVWQSCLVVFVLSWLGQFIGHKIEGKKPSFFDDLKFLLIGPLWLIHFVLLSFKIKY